MTLRKTLVFSAAVLGLAVPVLAEAAVFTVTKADDTSNPIVCGPSEPCSLREAITASNANGSGSQDEIRFNLPNTSAPLNIITELPPLTNVILDGTTQPEFIVGGAPVLTIDGRFLTSPFKRGLVLNGSVIVKSLKITKASDGVAIAGGGNSVQGSVIVDNAGAGITLINASGSVIGHTSPGQGNTIERNSVGIYMSGSANNLIIGNQIRSNLNDGIRLTGASTLGNKIGGTGAGEANVINSNAQDGIVLAGSGSRNTISANSISSNGDLGIDLGDNGLSANDFQEMNAIFGIDNDLQNFPVLATAKNNGCEVRVTGFFNTNPAVPSDPNDYNLEFFSNTTRESSGFGEGETFVGNASVNVDDQGTFNFNVPLSSLVEVGKFMTATATSHVGSTSEFSNSIAVTQAQDPGEIEWSAATASVGENAGSVQVFLERGCGATGEAAVTVMTSDGTASAGTDYTAVSQTVTFANGETEKVVPIAILGDSFVESSEFFTVTVSDPTNGAELGPVSQITVTITDDDSPTSSGGSSTDTPAGGSSGGCSLIR